MPFLLAEILNFQGSTHHIGVGSFSKLPVIVVDSTNLQHSSWEISNDAEEIVLRELVYI